MSLGSGEGPAGEGSRAGGAGGGWLEANLELLARNRPGLARLLGSTVPEPYELLRTRKGQLSARAGGRLLHSAYDPVGEAARLVGASLPPEAETAVLLGAGLGYAIEAALAAPGIVSVIVCEAEAGRLAAMLASRDLGAALSDPRLSFVVGGDPGAILLALDELRARSVGLVSQRALESADEAWYAALRSALGRFLAKASINENTLKRFGRLWVRNLARNAAAMARLPGIRELEGACAGLPALVLAAGPSLDEALPLLGELRERMVLIAVDTALRSLLTVGVEPDFLLVVDPQYWNWRHVADLASAKSCLVSEPAVWPAVLRARHRATFLSASLFPLGRALSPPSPGLDEERARLGAGGSVATSAWDLARHLGASSVCLAGLDLGYPDGHTHARASLFEQRALLAGRRIAPAATAQASALFGLPLRSLPATGGGSILSDERMCLYAWWFEARLARPDSPPTRSLSKRSLAIPGMGLATFEELLAEPARRGEIEKRLKDCESLGIPEGNVPRAALALDRLVADLRRIGELAEEGEAAAAKALSALTEGVELRPYLEGLDRVDRALHQSEAREVVSFFLPPLPELLGTRPRDLAESLASSRSLYAKVRASAQEHGEILELLAFER